VRRQEIRGQPIRVMEIRRMTNQGAGKSKMGNKNKWATD
jgi:hypothetical protein